MHSSSRRWNAFVIHNHALNSRRTSYSVSIQQPSRSSPDAMQLTLRVQPTEMIMSGWFDLTATGASFVTNRKKDPFFTKSTVEWLASNFVVDRDRQPDVRGASVAGRCRSQARCVP